MVLLNRRARLLLLLAALVGLLWWLVPSAVEEIPVVKPKAAKLRTARERDLGVEMPLQLPEAVTDYLDAYQFPQDKACTYGLPVGTWYNFPLHRFGVGAYFQHYSWYMNFVRQDKRMFVMLSEPSVRQPYQYANGGACRRGFFCGFHPISKCTDTQVWRGSEQREAAVRTGSFRGKYGRATPFVDSKAKDDVVDVGGIWNALLPQKGNCFYGLFVPAPFRRIGSDAEWRRLFAECRYDAFDHLPEGRQRANADVLRWRSYLIGYLFQPLPEVMRSIHRKRRRMQLASGDRCVSVHIRRGDKFKKGPHREGYFHGLDDYLERAARLIDQRSGSGTVMLHTDDFVGVLEEWKSSRFRDKLTLRYDPAEAGLSGWDVAKLYDLDDFYNVIGSVWLFGECPLTVGSLESVYYKLGIHIGVARGIWEAEDNIYNATFTFGTLGVPLRGWYNFVP